MNKKTIKEMNQAFNEIQMARTPYVIKHMVVYSKFTPEQRYAQCVLEMSIAYDNLRIAMCNQELKQIEINKMKGKSRTVQLNKKIKQVELEQLHRAMLGAEREFEVLFEMWQGFDKKFTREELNSAQEEEYTKRLELQAQQDMNATGRVSQGNQEGLRQIGKSVYPELDIIRDTEKRYLETGKSRLLIAVPTEKQATEGLKCIEKLNLPIGTEVKILNVWGRKVDDAYNYAVQEALKDNADFILTVEDDTFPEESALIKLMELIRANPNTAIGAWYPKKEPTKEGVHIILKDGKRQQLKADGDIHEVYTLAMGCSIYPIEMFLKIPYPWFKTTANLSQDSFFSQLARENGYKLMVDTSIKCKHIDRITGEIYQ